MKRIAIAVAVAGLAAATLAPAQAAAAPPWSDYTNVSGTLYGSEMSYDGTNWIPGAITDGDIDVDIYQTGGPAVQVISIHVHNGASLTGASSVSVSGIDGDSCNTTYQSTTYSGDEITIKGVYCWNDDADGRTELAVDVRGLTGTIMSNYFSDQEIDGQFRYYSNRRDKSGSYRYENDLGLDFVSDMD